MKSMNATVQTTLRRIVAQYGMTVIDDPLRCQGLLNDMCPMSKREVNSLVLVLKEGVPIELIRAGRSAPRQAVASRLVRQVVDNIGLSEDVARWAVESWSRAVDSLDPAVAAKVRASAPKATRTPAPSPAAVAKTPPKTKAIKPPLVNWKAVSDTVQQPAVLLPVAVVVVSAMYLLLLSSIYGGQVAVVVILAVSGGVALAAFAFYYPRIRKQNIPSAKSPSAPPPPPPKKPTP